MVTDELIDAGACAERVRATKRALFGSTLGNHYREQIGTLIARDSDGLKGLARKTRAAIVSHTIDDGTLAPMTVALLTRKREHAAVIFLALDLASISLMNPQLGTPESHRLWVEGISRTYDSPIAMILECVAWLAIWPTHI